MLDLVGAPLAGGPRVPVAGDVICWFRKQHHLDDLRIMCMCIQ